ncbi:MAG: AAA family ATPase [Thermoguttaceae bacterium]|nr:AAA family ATPase [Thermoguttaceae bacterium]MDW8079971.1 AAA family ATPase [Thermoguttaceae bacterium]
MTDVTVRDNAATKWEGEWLEWFGLRRRPFVAVPSPEHYCPLEPIESGRQNLVRMIRRGEGAGLVAGPPGTGKTLLCQLIARELASDFAVVLLSGGRIDSPKALYQAILFQLGLTFFGLDEGELRIALEAYLQGGDLPEFLTKSPRAKLPPRPVVLLVDEAHGLPLRILEDIRTLTNVVQEDCPRGHVILSGGMLLEDRLSSPRLEAFAQRIVVRVYLQAFTRPQTEAFLRHQLAFAGGDPDRIFSADAIDAVYRASGGIPRLVNQIADHAMFLAFAHGRKQINWQLVEEAWSDLQQLPGPWNDSQRRGERPSIIEFGHLSDERENRTDQTGRVVPFLRVAHPESGTEQSLLEKFDELEKAVESLATGDRGGDVAGPAVDHLWPTTGAERSDENGGRHGSVLSGHSIVVEFSPPPNPFTEPFDTEQNVNLWHVDYICRQRFWTFVEFLRGWSGPGDMGCAGASWWSRFEAEDTDEFIFPAPLAELNPDSPLWIYSTADNLLRSAAKWSLTNMPASRGKILSASGSWVIEIPLLCPPVRDETELVYDETVGLYEPAHAGPALTRVIVACGLALEADDEHRPVSGTSGKERGGRTAPSFRIPWCEEAAAEEQAAAPPAPVRRVASVQASGPIRQRSVPCHSRAG